MQNWIDENKELMSDLLELIHSGSLKISVAHTNSFGKDYVNIRKLNAIANKFTGKLRRAQAATLINRTSGYLFTNNSNGNLEF